jgi:DNA repair protein RadC
MSIPMKLSSMQDMNNTILNMTFDNLILSMKAPIFNGSGADIDIDWLYPKSIIDLPKGTNTNSIREFTTNPNTVTVGQNMLQMIGQRMDAISASGSEQSGISGAGRAKTAEEVATAREAAMSIAEMFLRFMEWAEEDRAEQRIQNMLYYYSKPLKNGKYRKVVVDNVRLLKGELGKMMVNITKEPRPTEQLDEINLQTDEMSQVVDITPELLRNFKYMIKIVPNASMKETEAMKLNKELQWYNITAMNQMVNQKENVKDLAEAFGKDVNKILATEQPAIPGTEGMPQAPATPQGMPTAPGADKMIMQ